MPWFKVDDGFYDHPKVADTSMSSRGLWMSAGTYCARHLTDGVITAKQVKRLGGTPAQIRGLIESGLWHQIKDDSGAVAYQFHDYLDFNPSANEVQTQREQARKRQQKHRGKPPTTSDNANLSRRDSRASHSAPTRPDPTQEGGGNPPSPPSTIPDELISNPRAARCPAHKGLRRAPACGECATLRETAEDAREQHQAHQAAAGKARRTQIDACTHCDENGLKPDRNGGVTRCNHPRTPPEAPPGDETPDPPHRDTEHNIEALTRRIGRTA